MSQTADLESTGPADRSRRCQFTLRALFVVMTVFATVIAALTYYYRPRISDEAHLHEFIIMPNPTFVSYIKLDERLSSPDVLSSIKRECPITSKPLDFYPDGIHIDAMNYRYGPDLSCPYKTRGYEVFYGSWLEFAWRDSIRELTVEANRRNQAIKEVIEKHIQAEIDELVRQQKNSKP